ncbi:helix-turn-helix transcriptional regulator [Chitinophaga pinensis]|uniref:Transcriptional regulator, AraC family n=1 Tax=Chitinophaga pinensis (strain ATCC 43595 / DSM 2588 / LMG 13176 / NBRC 15968 / NCIMB 11800 / UQM 2034) TaxID=485918 RepID=A0A979FYX6_CHIPD|nr:helix-turn-helix domain-containing protein [Chitinophaga pinensis]ACU57689.1 transcriptional regulator, AraC family [Chitinophaga pinensis DSM 2588]
MYTLYENLRFTGHDRMDTWQQGTHSWAAYSVYTQKAHHEVYTPHTILNLIVRGQKRMYDGRVIHQLQAGDVFIIPAGSLLCSEIPGQRYGYESINIELPDAIINKYSLPQTSSLPTPVGATSLTASSAWQQLKNELLQQFTVARSIHAGPSQAQIAAMALSLMGQTAQGQSIIRMLQLATAVQPATMHTLGKELFQMGELEEMARHACMSKATLKRRFRQVYDVAPMNWIWEKRLEQSAFLLRTQTDPIADIAYRSGFENISHFYRLFRNAFGMTPVAWRKYCFPI